jgi:hypothetical protein
MSKQKGSGRTRPLSVPGALDLDSIDDVALAALVVRVVNHSRFRDELRKALIAEEMNAIRGPKIADPFLSLVAVARLQGLSPAYLAECIRASQSEAYRIRRSIPDSTLLQLPLRGWFKRGNRWVIRASDLRAQL